MSTSADIGIGLTAEAAVKAGHDSFQDEKPFGILSTSVALPTACLSFDADAQTYGPAAATGGASVPTSAGGNASATARGHSGGRKSGANSVVNPFGVFVRGVGLRGLVAVAGLGVVGGCFVGL